MKLTEAEPRDCFAGRYRGKRVLVTGHTGFKGAWLCEWLLELGADVFGFSLAPPTKPALFEDLDLKSRMHHWIGDVRDLFAVNDAVAEAHPDYVFHLAAQPLVRLSYAEPVATYAVNIMGTAHVLDALRQAQRPCVLVAITTDKCYENREWVHSYREEDPLGGYDPYSSSKGAAELIISAYRQSFFSAKDSLVKVASARAGNVIGGGDWALDRIVPDCVRALKNGKVISVRNKIATRPWQHVLETLSGYLLLGAKLSASEGSQSLSNLQLASSFNFGPVLTSNRTVAELVEEVIKHWPGKWEDKSDPHAVHEAKFLNLSTDKAYHLLGWRPVWSFPVTIEKTMKWYREATRECRASELTRSQIAEYVTDARADALAWTQ